MDKLDDVLIALEEFETRTKRRYTNVAFYKDGSGELNITSDYGGTLTAFTFKNYREFIKKLEVYEK